MLIAPQARVVQLAFKAARLWRASEQTPEVWETILEDLNVEIRPYGCSASSSELGKLKIHPPETSAVVLSA